MMRTVAGPVKGAHDAHDQRSFRRERSVYVDVASDDGGVPVAADQPAALAVAAHATTGVSGRRGEAGGTTAHTRHHPYARASGEGAPAAAHMRQPHALSPAAPPYYGHHHTLHDIAAFGAAAYTGGGGGGGGYTMPAGPYSTYGSAYTTTTTTAAAVGGGGSGGNRTAAPVASPPLYTSAATDAGAHLGSSAPTAALAMGGAGDAAANASGDVFCINWWEDEPQGRGSDELLAHEPYTHAAAHTTAHAPAAAAAAGAPGAGRGSVAARRAFGHHESSHGATPGDTCSDNGSHQSGSGSGAAHAGVAVAAPDTPTVLLPVFSLPKPRSTQIMERIEREHEERRLAAASRPSELQEAAPREVEYCAAARSQHRNISSSSSGSGGSGCDVAGRGQGETGPAAPTKPSYAAAVIAPPAVDRPKVKAVDPIQPPTGSAAKAGVSKATPIATAAEHTSSRKTPKGRVGVRNQREGKKAAEMRPQTATRKPAATSDSAAAVKPAACNAAPKTKPQQQQQMKSPQPPPQSQQPQRQKQQQQKEKRHATEKQRVEETAPGTAQTAQRTHALRGVGRHAELLCGVADMLPSSSASDDEDVTDLDEEGFLADELTLAAVAGTVEAGDAKRQGGGGRSSVRRAKRIDAATADDAAIEAAAREVAAASVGSGKQRRTHTAANGGVAAVDAATSGDTALVTAAFPSVVKGGSPAAAVATVISAATPVHAAACTNRRVLSHIVGAILKARHMRHHSQRLELLSEAHRVLAVAEQKQQKQRGSTVAGAAAPEHLAAPPQLVVELLLHLAEVSAECQDAERSRSHAVQARTLAAQFDTAWRGPALMLAAIFVGGFHERMIEPVEAIAEVGAAMRLAIELRCLRAVARCVSMLAVEQELMGVFRLQRAWYAVGRRLARESRDTRLAARLAVAEATLLLTLGEPERVVEIVQAALPLLLRVRDTDPQHTFMAYQLLAQAHLHCSNLAEAERYFRLELEATAAAEDPMAEAQALAELAMVLRHRGRHAAACELAAREVRLVLAAQFPQRDVEALSNAGQQHRHAGQFENALALHQRELQRAEDQDDSCLIARAHFDLGELRRVQGADADAVTSFMTALVTLEQVSDEARRSYLVRVQLVEVEWRALDSLELIHLAAGRVMDALRYASRKHVNPMVEKCARGRELRLRAPAGTTTTAAAAERVPPADAAAFEWRCVPTAEELCGLCDACGLDAIVLYSTLWEDHEEMNVYVLRAGAGEPQHIALPLKGNWLAALLAQDSSFLHRVNGGNYDTPLMSQVYLDLLFGGARERAAQQPTLDDDLRMFYSELVAPVEAALPAEGRGAAPRVCFIADGVLGNVPFAATRGPDGAYLIERFAVTSAPSLQHLAAFVREEQRQHYQGGSPALAIHVLQPPAAAVGAPPPPELREIAGGAAAVTHDIAPAARDPAASAPRVTTSTAAAVERAADTEGTAWDPWGAAAQLMALVDAEARDAVGARGLHRAVIAAQVDAHATARRLVLVNALPSLHSMREDWCGAMATRAAPDEPLVTLLESADVARGLRLDSVAALFNVAAGAFNFRVVHEAAVPLHRAFHYAGARRVVNLHWLLPAHLAADVEAHLRVVLRELGGEPGGLADALRAAALGSIRAARAAAQPVEATVEVWGAFALSGLP